MLEVLIGVGGFVVGYGVNWYFGHAYLNEVEDDLAFELERWEELMQELEDARVAHLRVSDSQSVALEKVRAIRELIDGTTRVRSSRIREVLGD